MAATELAGSLGKRAVLIPVKSFKEAKRRLSGALSDIERQTLARHMATQVLRAAAPLSVAVVCDDDEVARWAREHDALVVWEPGRGLNRAVESGVAQLASLGVERVIVAHGDLPFAEGLANLSPSVGITIIPDRRNDGTNVIELPANCGFRFSYGPGSYGRHLKECERIGVEVQVLHPPSLAFDVDLPADLDEV
jgi:2-phospho-L-lactate guanylyltransferase